MITAALCSTHAPTTTGCCNGHAHGGAARVGSLGTDGRYFGSVRPGHQVHRRSGWTVGRRVAVWLIGSLVGAAIIALPDSDDRLFSLSRTHGPSPVDLLGMLVLLVVWTPVPVILWRRRHALHGRAAAAIAVLAVAGVVGLVVTVGLDLGPVYLIPVMMLLLAQLLALRVVAGPDR